MTWTGFWIASAIHACISIFLLYLLFANCDFLLREGGAAVEASRRFGIVWRSPWLILGIMVGHSMWSVSDLLMVVGCIAILLTLTKYHREI